MVLSPGRLIKHKDNVDVAFMVLKSWDFPESSKYKIKGFWINLGFTAKGGWRISNSNVTIKIQKSRINEWQLCVDEKPILRESEWKSIAT